MAEQEKGFLAQFGLGVEAPFDPRGGMRGGSVLADAALLSRTAGRGVGTQLASGLFQAVKGQVRPGEGGQRGFKEFGRDFQQGIANVRDYAIASDMGISVEKLRARRALEKKLDATVNVGSGSLEEQINAAEAVAREANAMGQIDVAMAAAQMKAQLRKQLEQQKQAGIATEQAEINLREDETLVNMGVEASVVGKDDWGQGKAIRIDSANMEELGFTEDEIGKYVFVDQNGQRHIVDGVDLRKSDDGGLKDALLNDQRAQNNFLKIVAANGGNNTNITKMRGTLTDMTTQATILTDVTGFLNNMANPELAFDLTGKTAIQANRVVQLAQNAATILTEANNGVGSAEKLGSYSYNGEKVQGEAELRSKFINAGKQQEGLLGTLNRIASDSGLPRGNSLSDFIPREIMEKLADADPERVAKVAEQYWANVMELAYLDARLQEPSNRGLSDKDIENALRRIGAATANPASFAQRQLTLLSRLEDGIQALGNSITVPPGSRYSRNEVIDFIYRPETRQSALQGIAEAKAGLVELRGNFLGKPDQSVFQRAMSGDESLTDEELATLTPEQINQLLGQ